jgi:hypothetical protein
VLQVHPRRSEKSSRGCGNRRHTRRFLGIITLAESLRSTDHSLPTFLGNPTVILHLTHPLATMSFIQSVAGPSRLPAQLVRAAPRSACSGSRRHYAAPAAKPPPKQGVDTRTVKPEFTRAGYETWLHSIGEDYKSTEPGQPARWLGGRTVSGTIVSIGVYN